MSEQLTAASFQVLLNGQPLPPEVELVHAVIEDSLHHPDSFELELRDIDRGLLARLGLEIGATVKVSVLGDTYASGEKLIEGEVTGLDAEIDAGTNVTIVRGYDHSHRLFRGNTTTSYQNVTVSEVASKVAKRAGLVTGTIDPTSPALDHISQPNQNDWDFLTGLARRVGFEVAVSDAKFHFRKPLNASTAPVAADLSQENPLQLLMGSSLIRLRSSITSAGQVAQVQARGWDPLNKKAVVGNAPANSVSAQVGITPKKLASLFPSPSFVASSVPMTSSAEVDNYAKAIAEEVASSFAELEGVARGNPKLKAGSAVNVSLVGKPFDGKYVLSNSRHVYDRHEGYLTHFTVSGRGDRSLYALASGDGGTGGAGVDRVNGLMIGIVDDVADKQGHCRVRLRFPTLSEDYVSDWARTVQPGAGDKRGWTLVPEVGDEVLVGFDHGDFRCPFVLGGLFNGKDKPDLGGYSLIDNGKHSVDVRRFVSRKGHSLTFSDADGKEKIVVQSQDGKLLVELDVTGNTIKISSGGKIEVTSTADTTIEAKGKLTLKGSQVSVEAQSSLTAKGATVSIDAQASLEAKASGTVSVKGALIQLN